MTSKVEIGPIREDELVRLASLQKELIEEKHNLNKMCKLFQAISLDTNYHLLGVRNEGHLIGSLVAIACHDLFGKSLHMIIENVIAAKDAQKKELEQNLWKEQRFLPGSIHVDISCLFRLWEELQQENSIMPLGMIQSDTEALKKMLNHKTDF